MAVGSPPRCRSVLRHASQPAAPSAPSAVAHDPRANCNIRHRQCRQDHHSSRITLHLPRAGLCDELLRLQCAPTTAALSRQCLAPTQQSASLTWARTDRRASISTSLSLAQRHRTSGAGTGLRIEDNHAFLYHILIAPILPPATGSHAAAPRAPPFSLHPWYLTVSVLTQ